MKKKKANRTRESCLIPLFDWPGGNVPEEPNESQFYFLGSSVSSPIGDGHFGELNEDDASALVDFFRLLSRWSREQERGREDD